MITRVVSERTAVIDLITRVVSERTAVIDWITRVVSERTAVIDLITRLVSGRSAVIDFITRFVLGRTAVIDLITRVIPKRTAVIDLITPVVSFGWAGHRRGRELRIGFRVLRKKSCQLLAPLTLLQRPVEVVGMPISEVVGGGLDLPAFEQNSLPHSDGALWRSRRHRLGCSLPLFASGKIRHRSYSPDRRRSLHGLLGTEK